MGIIDTVFNKLGYMNKADIKPQIIKVPLVETTPRPASIDKYTDLLEFYKSKIKNYNYSDLSKNTTILRNIHSKYIFHTFKEGFNIHSKYVKKCKSCDTDYDCDIDICDVCGGINFTKPNDKHRLKIENIIKSANVNSYPLKFELKSVTLDLLRYDEGAMIKIYNYYFDPKTKLLSKEFKYIERIVPTYLFPNISQSGVLGSSYINNSEGFCPIHRDNGVIDLKKLVCSICGAVLLTADYYVLYTEDKNRKRYYNRDELIRMPLFEISSRYSLIQTLIDKVTSLLAIDGLINDIYVLRKYPNRGLFFKTSNIDSLIESNEKNKVELKKDKNYIPMYAVGSDKEGEFVKVIDMLGSIDELKLIELQDKYEKDICSAYDCKLDFVTREVIPNPQFIKELQITINEYVLNNIVKSMAIDDWELTLRPSQKEEEANELRLRGLKIQNATGMVNLGFDILDFDEERQDFVFSDKPTRNSSDSFSSFSSNARGLEDTFGPMPGYDKLSSPKTDKK